MQFNEDGIRIPVSESEYIWISGMIGNRQLSNVAPAFDAAIIPLKESAQQALIDTLSCLKQAVGNNFASAFFTIASAGMCLHYENVIEIYGMCPTPVAVGVKNTGKSTAARTAIALLGIPQFLYEISQHHKHLC